MCRNQPMSYKKFNNSTVEQWTLITCKLLRKNVFLLCFPNTWYLIFSSELKSIFGKQSLLYIHDSVSKKSKSSVTTVTKINHEKHNVFIHTKKMLKFSLQKNQRSISNFRCFLYYCTNHILSHGELGKWSANVRDFFRLRFTLHVNAIR